jgi:hypothetical protein
MYRRRKCGPAQRQGTRSRTARAPSTIRTNTICRSCGEIPDELFRAANAPDSFVSRAGSLVGQPIQFSWCFISCSSKDQDFADRLHADLQSEGARCWFAPEHLKTGHRFRDRIDQSICVYEKLLVVLTEESVWSSWVEKEHETGFGEERQRKTTVLFRIRLDDAVMETDQAWATDIRQTRHIGGLRTWKDRDSYQKVFDRLLWDLKAGEAKTGGVEPMEAIDQKSQRA